MSMHDFVPLIPDYLDVFFGRASVEQGLPLEEAIPRDQLDFSLDSLQLLDTYLEQVVPLYETLPNQQVINLALAAGVYLGEVIRRNARRRYTWLNYAQYFDAHPDSKGVFPYCPGTTALLASDAGAMTLPINKILRFLDEGPENTTHSYASIEGKQ